MKKLFLIMMMLTAATLGGCWRNNEQTTQPRVDTQSQNQSQPQVNDVPSIKQYSYRDLVEGKKNLKCTYDESTGDTQTMGMLYVDSDHQRMAMNMNIKTQEEGKTNEIMMNGIIDDNYSYTWSKDFPGEVKGMKIKLDKESEVTSGDQQIDMDHKVNMNCEDWNIDESMFELPKDIQFSDMGEMVQNMMNTGNTQGLICQTCDAIKDAQAKQMCKQQNNCK